MDDDATARLVPVHPAWESDQLRAKSEGGGDDTSPQRQEEPLTNGVDFTALPILNELGPEVLTRLLPRCRVAAFADQDVILHKGRPNDLLHFLLSGKAEVHFDLVDRSEPIEIATGRIFGEISVIDEMPATANVVAVGPCQVLLVPASFFWSEVVTTPGVARSLMRRLGQMVRENSAVLVRTMQDRLRHAAMEQELRLAHDIQMGMLRRLDVAFQDRQDFRIAAVIKPARQVSGDFYDAFLLDPDHLVMAIGDVAGKGVSASLFMVRGLTLLRNPTTHWVSLERTLSDANSVLARDNDTFMFLTLFMAVLDLRTGNLDYVNFGHPPPLVRAPNGEVAFQDVRPGVVFGVMPDAAGGSGQLTVPPGGTLLLYSDGVTEGENLAQTLFGAERLLTSVTAAQTNEPALLIRTVSDAVSRHAGGAEQSDDITLMAVTWLGRST